MTDSPTPSLTGERLNEIRGRLSKITPGPWAWEWIAEQSNEWAVGQAFDANGGQLSGHITDHDDMVETVIERRLVGMNESGHASAADAEFIAHAPQDITDLIADITVRTQEIERLANQVADYYEQNTSLRAALTQAEEQREFQRNRADKRVEAYSRLSAECQDARLALEEQLAQLEVERCAILSGRDALAAEYDKLREQFAQVQQERDGEIEEPNDA